ncbi:MAG: copper resistance protein NlpE N-terminal domain-containing protein, partial [Nitrospiraceae bacterium]
MVISTGLMCAMGFSSVAAAAEAKSAPTPPATSSRGETQPATYAGEIPCADCPGQHLVLTLFPDHTFRLRQTYVGVAGGKDEDHYDLGRWARAQDDGDRLRLNGGMEAPRLFRFVDKDRLRMLDNEGRDIRSKLNYDLVQQADVDPVPGPILLRGLYAYMADTATFSECMTGTRYPVSIEGAHIDIERAYTARTEGNQGMPLLATLTARFVKREPEPGAPAREYLLV